MTPRQEFETLRRLQRELRYIEEEHGDGHGIARARAFLLRLMAVLAAALCVVLIVLPAVAHDSWISRGGLKNAAGEWCCGEGDCFVIPSKAVSITAQGYRIDWHAVVDGKDAVGTEIVPFSEAQPSPDGQYWRCKRPDGTRRCFFAPPPSM